MKPEARDLAKTKEQLAAELEELRLLQAQALSSNVGSPTQHTDATHSEPSRSELDTVSVPEAFAPVFLKAQDYVARYFASKIADPTKSTISIAGERYILVRAASMSVEFVDLVRSLYQDRGEEEARRVANNLLYDLAHAIGKADAKAFHAQMGVTDPIEKLSAGPIHFAYSGWAYVSILPESAPSPDDNYYLIYDHPFSFEADAWLRQQRETRFPVCMMNAGYSSGWCAESFGLPLVAVEVGCQAKGDEHCRFIMSPPHRIEGHLARYFDHAASASSAEVVTEPHRVAVPEFFERKRLEEALHEANRGLERRVAERTAELESANRSLQQEMAERQQAQEALRKSEEQLFQAQKMESIGTLAGGIAHDFNNILAAIIGQAEILYARCRDQEEVSRRLGDLLSAANRAAALTGQLLAFSRRQPLQRRAIDLGSTIHDFLKLLRRIIGQEMEIRLQLESSAPPIFADPRQVEQVLMNLAINARDAQANGGQLLIETHCVILGESDCRPQPSAIPGRYVLMAVSDQGSGMDAATRERIFEPFFTTKEVGKGTGLGLAVVYGIVTQHGGWIEVESEPGRGASFKLYWPVAATSAAETPMALASVRGGSETILVAEDEPMLRELVSEVLSEAGYRVIAAGDGQEAVELFRARHSENLADNLAENLAQIDLVILDVMMPRLGGHAAYEQIRALSPRVPIVFMTGYSTDLVVPAEADWLQKPCGVEALKRKVREVLDRSQQRANE